MIVGKSLLKEVITALKPNTFKTRLNRIPMRMPTTVAGTMLMNRHRWIVHENNYGRADILTSELLKTTFQVLPRFDWPASTGGYTGTLFPIPTYFRLFFTHMSTDFNLAQIPEHADTSWGQNCRDGPHPGSCSVLKIQDTVHPRYASLSVMTQLLHTRNASLATWLCCFKVREVIA